MRGVEVGQGHGEGGGLDGSVAQVTMGRRLAGSLIALLVGITLFWVVSRHSDATDMPRKDGFYGRSSVHTGAYGTKALLLLFQKLEIPVSRRMQPLEFFSPEGLPLLILGAPILPYSKGELRWLNRYVSSGGAVLVIPQVQDEAGTHGRPMGVALLSQVGLELTDGGIGADSEDGVHLSRQIPIQAGWISRSDGEPAAIGFRSANRLTWRQDAWPASQILAEDELGMAAVVAPWGDGHFVILSDLFPLTNRGLQHADNGPMLVSLARVFGGKDGVIFDEYHHGLMADRSLVQLMADAGSGWLVLQALIAGALWAYAGSVRFGFPREPDPRERRTGLEQVKALANLSERTGARTVAARALWRRFAQRLGARVSPFGNPAEVTLAIVAALETRDHVPPRAVLAVAQIAQAKSISSEELVAFDRHLEDLWRTIERNN